MYRLLVSRKKHNNAKRREKLYARGGNLSTMKGGLSYIFFSFFPPIFDITIARLIYVTFEVFNSSKRVVKDVLMRMKYI